MKRSKAGKEGMLSWGGWSGNFFGRCSQLRKHEGREGGLRQRELYMPQVPILRSRHALALPGRWTRIL